MLNDFCAFILTHGRPDKVHTYNALKREGYTGKVFIIIDNEDKQAEKYKENFGEQVIVFDKKAVALTIDEGDNFEDRRAIIYARNACFGIAEKLGFKYFIELDDDYTDFRFKVNENYEVVSFSGITDLDRIFEAYLKYYKSIPALSIAMAQGGDFIGGKDCSTWKNGFYPHRKCMNTFICSTDRPFEFSGRINEDVNTYTCLASRGNLFMTIPLVGINQLQTQGNSGGMTELYLDSGTYVKSFYTVMYSPSSVKIRMMGAKDRRLHHSISWANAVPVILAEIYKKGVKNAVR